MDKTLPAVGSVVRFCNRRGHIVAYTALARYGWNNEIDTYAVVDLDPESRGYLGSHSGNEMTDFFVSMVIIHPQSFLNDE